MREEAPGWCRKQGEWRGGVGSSSCTGPECHEKGSSSRLRRPPDVDDAVVTIERLPSARPGPPGRKGPTTLQVNN